MRNILNTLQGAQRAEKRNNDRINREVKMKKSKSVWIPKVILILLTAFISFSFDVFEGNASLVEKLLALLIHLIPSFLMIAYINHSLDKTKTWGVLCLILAIAMGIMLRVWNVFTNIGQANAFESIFRLIFVTVILITGVLFIIFSKTKQAA